MPQYHFRLNTPDQAIHLAEPRELPGLREALATAHSLARSLIHTQMRRAPIALQGRLDVEDERRQPVARILLSDVARQIS